MRWFTVTTTRRGSRIAAGAAPATTSGLRFPPRVMVSVEHTARNAAGLTQAPAEEPLDFVLTHGLTDILINRNEYTGFQVTGTGTHGGGEEGPAYST